MVSAWKRKFAGCRVPVSSFRYQRVKFTTILASICLSPLVMAAVVVAVKALVVVDGEVVEASLQRHTTNNNRMHRAGIFHH